MMILLSGLIMVALFGGALCEWNFHGSSALCSFLVLGALLSAWHADWLSNLARKRKGWVQVLIQRCSWRSDIRGHTFCEGYFILFLLSCFAECIFFCFLTLLINDFFLQKYSSYGADNEMLTYWKYKREKMYVNMHILVFNLLKV